MAMASNEIEELIKAAFPDAIITIEDLRAVSLASLKADDDWK